MCTKFSLEMTQTKGDFERFRLRSEDTTKMKHNHVMIGCGLKSFCLGQETVACFSFHKIRRISSPTEKWSFLKEFNPCRHPWCTFRTASGTPMSVPRYVCFRAT